MTPLISIIVPVYNIDRYINRCIESIICQTYQNLQIIIVDDGSVDNSGYICDKYADKDNRIKVIHQTNSGLVDARKKGLSIAMGEYIGFVDGDDYIEPEMFSMLYEEIEKTNADFVHSLYKINNSNSIFNPIQSVIYDTASIDIAAFYKTCIFDSTSNTFISPSIWSKLFKREIIINSYMSIPNSQSYGEDLLCLCKCVFLSKRIAITVKGNYHYTVRNDSLSHKRDITALTNEFGLFSCLCHLFKEINLFDELQSEINMYFYRGLSNGLTAVSDVYVPLYSYPCIQELLHKNIIIYGAGQVGHDYYYQFSKYHNLNIIAWIDKNFKALRCDFFEISSPDILNDKSFDMLIVSVIDENTALSITHELIQKGIDPNRIIWKKPQYIIR